MLEILLNIGDIVLVKNVLLEFFITGLLSYIVTFLVNIYLKLKQHHVFVSEFDKNFTDFKKEVNDKFFNLDSLISYKTNLLDIKIDNVQTKIENNEEDIQNVQRTVFSINDTVIKLLSK